jgi:hypothetical protein
LSLGEEQMKSRRSLSGDKKAKFQMGFFFLGNIER